MTLTQEDYIALLTTLKLAGLSTLLLLIIATPLAWWLAKSNTRFKFIIEALIALPLVLPPTVLGFYLLIMMGPNGWLGGFSLAFTFNGLLLGSVIYSLPFVVQPLQNAFANIGHRPFDVAATLGASRLDQFISIALPLARPGFITAAVLGFAHTIGEFGVVLMIGGNIPGQTKLASIAIYEHVEALDYAKAHTLSAILLALSFILLLFVYATNKKFKVGA